MKTCLLGSESEDVCGLRGRPFAVHHAVSEGVLTVLDKIGQIYSGRICALRSACTSLLSRENFL